MATEVDKHREEEARLLEAIKAKLTKLEALLAQTEDPWTPMLMEEIREVVETGSLDT